MFEPFCNFQRFTLTCCFCFLEASADAIFSGLKKAANKKKTTRAKKKEGVEDNQSSAPGA